MYTRFLFLGLLATLTALAQVDHGPFWQGPRYQGGVGSCHAHAAIALLEGEHSAQFGQKTDFSEAHLFIRHMLGPTDADAQVRLGNQVRAAVMFRVFRNDYAQGGYIHTSFQLAREHGLVAERRARYSVVEGLVGEVDGELSRLEGDYRRKGRLSLEEDMPPSVERVLGRTEGARRRLYGGELPRERVGWVEGLTYSHHTVAEEGLAEVGRLLKEKIACRPVGVEADGSVWGVRYYGGHAVVVVGHDPSRREFIVRNSWGRAGLLHAHERIAEADLLPHLRSIGWLENPALECFPR